MDGDRGTPRRVLIAGRRVAFAREPRLPLRAPRAPRVADRQPGRLALEYGGSCDPYLKRNPDTGDKTS
jgi:hypothetical protein